jgi:PAS domain S-box-containing protein
VTRLSVSPLVYIVAVVATGAAALIRHVVGDLGGHGPLGPFFLVILLTGWLGGWKPGVFATVLSTIATGFFVERTGFVFNDVGDTIAVALFFVFGLVTSWLCEISHRRARRLEAQEQALRTGQKLLDESEERYRLLTEAQPGMVWTLRPDNTVDFVNSAWVAYTGRTLDGIDANGWRDLIHPDDREAMSAAISAPLERGEPHEVQVRFRRHDGMYRRVLSRVVPVRDGNGHVIKWIGTTTDIHDLWVAREGLRESTVKLQESEKRFSHVAAAPVLIWSSGPDKRYDWFNESWLAFTGRTLEQELGDGWREGVHPQDRERCFETYAAAFDARQPFTMEYRLRHRDGTYRRVLDEGVPRSIDGRFYGYIGSAVDVTEQRLLEEQMLHSKKMEAVGQLAGGVAHDFNNLLTIINGYTDLMLARFTAEDTTRHDLEEVRIAGQRAASLTSQLLAFGRRQARQPTVLDIAGEVAESAKTLRRVLGADVEIVVENDGARAQARADRSQFAQVLLNLAVNAREAMPDGGRLTFSTSVVEFGGNHSNRHPRLTPRRYVRLAIVDTGRGMTPEVKARIFEPFFTTKEFGGGSGLGLSVVHGIVEQSDGHIEVESESGRGTTFFIFLPIADVS